MTKALPPEMFKKEETRALFEAAKDGDAAEVARLLDAGADASARRADGFTPLILAVFFGHEPAARLLVERGADARARTSLGTTAAGWAAARGFTEMADLLREAEAASAARAGAHAAEAEITAATPKPAAGLSDEVDIFSRKGERRGPRDAAEVAHASRRGTLASALAPVLFAPASNVSAPALSPLGLSRPDTGASDAETAGAAGVSLRRGGQSPSHPSANAFRLGHFLRSWQGSVGTALLLLAFAVAVFAFLQGGAQPPRSAAPAAPAQPTPAPQAAAQPTPPAPPETQPSPGFPTPDAQGVMPVTDPAFAVPSTAGQPFYVPQGAPAPVPADVPRDLTVVSESGAPANEEAGRAKRKAEAGANGAAPAQGNTRAEPGAEADSRDPRPARTPDPEQRTAPPAASPNPPPPAATPQPTPGRAKVIPWPPQ